MRNNRLRNMPHFPPSLCGSQTKINILIVKKKVLIKSTQCIKDMARHADAITFSHRFKKTALTGTTKAGDVEQAVEQLGNEFYSH